MKLIFTQVMLFLTLQVQAQIFQQQKSYEQLYVESDFVIEARHIANKNVIIKNIYRHDDEDLNAGDTLYIGWLSEYELRDPPEQVFLFLKKIETGNTQAYNTIDIQPMSNSRYEQVSDGIIWCDKDVCYQYSYPVQGYMRLKTMYTETQQPVAEEDIQGKLNAFRPYFEKYIEARNMKEDSVKAQLLVSYLFSENTPAPPYYDLFAQLEMKDPAWTTLTFEYTHAMISYFRECDDTARLTYPLQVLLRTVGTYNEYILLRMKDLLKRNTHQEDHVMMIQIMAAKDDEFAREIMRKFLHAKNKQDQALTALMLYSMDDQFSMKKIKKVLLKDEPAYKTLQWLYTIEPEKTKDFIQHMMPDEDKEAMPEQFLSILK